MTTLQREVSVCDLSKCFQEKFSGNEKVLVTA